MKRQIEEFTKIGITEDLNDGHNYVQCPQCQDSRKKSNQSKKPLNAHVEINNNWYKCNHCGWGGSLEALEKYKKVKEWSRYEQPSKYSAKAKKYFEGRGIDEYTMLLCGVQEQNRKSRSGEPIDLLCFPLTRNGILVNTIFRYIDKKGFFLSRKDDGAEMVFLGLDDIDPDHDEVIITEGIFDYLTLRSIRDEHGNPVYKNVVSVPAGVPPIGSDISPEAMAYLYEYKFASISPKIKTFILMTDGDEAGAWLASNLAKRLQKPRCKTVTYPVGYKDANAVLMKYGKMAIEKMYEEARSYPLKGIIKAFDIQDRILKIRETGFTPGYKCGIPDIDNVFTFKPPYFYVVTGESSTGKSVFTRWYFKELINYNEKDNLHFCVFSPEMRPPEREISSWIQLLAGGNIKRNEQDSISEEALQKAMRWTDEHLTFIAPGANNFEELGGKVNQSNFNTVDSLFEHVKAIKNQKHVTGIIIDAWNTLDHTMAGNENEVQYINRTLEKIIEFGETYDVGVYMVAHPHKLAKTKDGHNVVRCHMNNINGGQPWKNKTDVGIVLHRDVWIPAVGEDGGEVYDNAGEKKYVYDNGAPLQVYMDKLKFKELGSYGKAELVMTEHEGFIAEGGDPGYCDRPIRDLKIEKNDKFDENLPF